MKLRTICVVALSILGAASASAAPAVTTANLNLRTGPDIDFPKATQIPEGDGVEVHGCLRDESWCDISWEGERGWVFSEYLALAEGDGYQPLLDAELPAMRIPYVTFAARDYWDRFYVQRPWFAERDRWMNFNVRPRPGWHAPPAGPRAAGWWRRDYRLPAGMMGPPPEGGWRPRHGGPGAGPGGPPPGPRP